jgi:predicted nucleic acid-binding Zn ribbon protein
MTICPTCGAQSPEGAIFCDECGASLQSRSPQTVSQPPVPQIQPAAVATPGTRNCPVCGTPTLQGSLFCENCGASLAQETTLPPVADIYLPPTVAIPGAQTPAEAITAPGVPAVPEPSPSPVTIPPSQLTCINCGAILERDSAFCDMCGTPVKAASQTIDQVQLTPSPPAMPGSTPDSSAGVEPTLVGGYQVQQDFPPPKIDNFGTPQQYGPTQVGEYTPPQSFEQPPIQQSQAAGYGVPQSYGQPQAGYGVPVSAPPARFLVPGTNISLPLPRGKVECIVGREDPISNIYPDIDLTDYGGDESGVSRQHARLTLQGSQYYITDMQSTNYTYINKQRLQPNLAKPLRDGDEVQFGRLKLIFRQ